MRKSERLIPLKLLDSPVGIFKEVGKVKQSVKLPLEAARAINDILNKGNDVLIKFRENKGEVEIIEQRVTTKNKFKITE